MRKILAMIVLLSVVILVPSCDYRDVPKYEDITYRENGLEFKLPNDMKRLDSDEYDFYFVNIIETVIFTAAKLDSEFVVKNDIEYDLTAEEYVNTFIKRNNLNKEDLYYAFDENTGRHSLRYTFAEAGSSEIFYYVVVLGDVGNVWYLEMVTANEDSSRYLGTFENWSKSVRTYSEN